MTISVPKVRINNPSSNTKNVTAIGHSQNGTGNTPTFSGKIWEVKNAKIINGINWLGEDFSSAMQRLVSGVTALMTQPFFDLNNKKTDEKTRTTSAARTLGKIIAGTTTGVLIRQVCVELTKKWTQNAETEKHRTHKEFQKHGKILKEAETIFTTKQQLLLPKNKLNASFREIKAYRGAIGTFAAVLVMVGTNFLIDAPLTTYLTNFFVKRFTKNSEPQKQLAVEGGK